MPKFLNDLTLGNGTNGVNLVLGTTTGTKIGTSTSQKLSFYGVTTVVQQTPSTELRQMLVNYGLLSSTAAQNLDLNGGTLTAAGITFTGLRTVYESRTLPVSNVTNNCVNIGTFTFTNGGATLDIDVVVADSGFSVGKKYQIPIQYNGSASFQKAIPLADTGAYSGQDFDLDIQISANTCNLRLRRSLGTTAGTARVTIKQYGVTTDAYSSSSTVSTNSAPTTAYGTLSAGTLAVTTDLASGAQIKIQPFTFHAGWIDMPAISGKASGIGSGGPGVQPWIAYAGSGGNWFADSAPGDICYRNTAGDLRFGNSTGNAALVISGGNIYAQNPLITQDELDAAQISMSGNILMNGNALFLGTGSDSFDGFALYAEGGTIFATTINGETEAIGLPYNGLTINGGNSAYPTSADGGTVSISGGSSTSSGGGTQSYGGTITLNGGISDSDSGNGGDVVITSGQAPNTTSGNVVIDVGSTTFGQTGSIVLNAAMRASSVIIRGNSNTSLFYVDTPNNRVGIKSIGASGADLDVGGYVRAIRMGFSTTSSTGRLNFFPGTTVADGIVFGTDSPGANLYRSAASTIRTDGILDIAAVSLASTSTDGLIIENTTAATSGASIQMSPRIKLRGRAFDGLGDSTTDFLIETLPIAGSTASANLRFGYSYHGGSISYPMSLSSAGSLILDGNSAITSNPPSAASNVGWKASYYSTSYAIGITNSTFAVKSGTWLSLFGGNPAGNGTSTTTDTNAIASLGNYNGSTPMLVLGTDTNLYRSAADTLKTDDALIVTGTLTGATADLTKLELTVSGSVWSTYCSTGDTTNVKGFFTTVNTQYVSGTSFTPIDTTKSSWYFGANGTNGTAAASYDNFRISRAPIGSSTYTDLLTLTNGGLLSVPAGISTGSISNNISTQKVIVSKAGTTVGTRHQINLIEGTATSITVADNSFTDSVDVTIALASGNSAYAQTFNATTDWGTASGGKYTITFTHNLNTYACAVELWDETSGKIQTFGGDVAMTSVNAIAVSVPQTPDGRFAGRIVIMANGIGTGAIAYLASTQTFTGQNTFDRSDSFTAPIVSNNSGGGTSFDVNATGADMGTYVIGYDAAYGIPVSLNGETTGPNFGNPLFILTYEQPCFVAGTPILTPDGYKPIETIKVGDKVLSMDERSRFVYETEVIKTFVHKPRPDGYLIVNETMKVTRNHDVFINDQWKPIGKAEVGDYLINAQGKKVWIYSIEEVAEGVETYNFQIKEKAKNYFAHDLLVHNKCPFLYVFDKGNWIYQNTFIYELDAPEKEAVQRRKLRTLTNEFVVREIEPETSHIKDMALIAITPQGEKRLAWVNRIENFVTNHRDIVKVSFEPLPPDTTELYIEAKGYYIWKGD